MFWQTKTSYEFGPFLVDARERQLLRDGKPVPLTPKVFDVLLVLAQNSGHILSKDELMKLVWPDTAVEEGNLARNISTLRRALGETSGRHEYVETIPWRGYRFAAEVKEVRDSRAGPQMESIAVLPFVNVAADPNLEYLSDGITESLIDNLSQLTALKVMSRNSVFRYKECEAHAQTVGRELNVQAVLMGRVAQRGDLLSVSVELVDARDDAHIWGAQYSRHPADIYTMQQNIAQEIAVNLRFNMTQDEKQRIVRHRTDNTEAYHLYLKGRFFFNKLTMEGVKKAIAHFEQAIERDSHYALAYCGLVDGHNYLGDTAAAKKAATKALELDQTLGEAHASLAFHRFIYDWDFAGAETEFKQALELNPNYAEAHHWYAIYLANMGRHDQALPLAKRAVELDPLSPLMNMTPALASYLARRYDEAVDALRKIIEMEPGFMVAHSVLGNVYVQKGMYGEAMAEYQKVLELSKGVPVVAATMKAVIAHAYARRGKESTARKILAEIIDQTGMSPHFIAEIYGALGEKDLAFEWLDKAYAQHDMQMVSLRVNPTLDGLRSDSRFADVLQRVGL